MEERQKEQTRNHYNMKENKSLLTINQEFNEHLLYAQHGLSTQEKTKMNWTCPLSSKYYGLDQGWQISCLHYFQKYLVSTSLHQALI